MHQNNPAGVSSRTVLIICSLFHGINDATWAILPAVLPFITGIFTLSYLDVGILYAAMMIVMVVLQPIAGSLADRFNELDLLALGGFLVFSTCLLIFYARTYFELFLFNLIYSAGFSFYHPVSYAVLSRVMYGPAHRTKAMGISGSIGDLGNFTAFASTGIVAAHYGWNFPFFVWAILALFIALVYLLVLRPKARYLPSEILKRNGGSEPQRKVSGFRLIVLVVSLCIVIGALYRTLVGFTTLFLTDVVLMTPVDSDLLFSLFILFGVFGAFSSGYIVERIGLAKALLLEFIAVAACMFSLYLDAMQTFPLVALPLIVSGLALYASYPAIYSLAAEVASFGKRGQSYGILVSTTFVGGFAISILDGWLADLMGGLSIVYPLGALIALVGIVLTKFVPR